MCNQSDEYFINKRNFDKRCSTSVAIVLREKVMELLCHPLVELEAAPKMLHSIFAADKKNIHPAL